MDNQPRLPFYEKLAASLIFSALLTLILFNLLLAEPELPLVSLAEKIEQPLIEVSIKGAVELPGIYQVRKGATVEKVLEFARPLKTADLKRIKLDSKILRRRTITVPESKCRL